MAHCFTITRNMLQIAAGRKVIKAQDYSAFIEADRVVDAARRAADHIHAEADRAFKFVVAKNRQMQEDVDNAYQAARQEGYQAGFASARHDYAAEINGALIDRAEILDQVEYSLVDMLIASLKTILGDMGVDQTVRGLAIKALRHAGRKQFAKLRVHPDRIGSVQSVVRNVKEDYEGLEWIEVVADANLRPADCLLQTPAGILDFSLDTQLRVLQECLSARIKKAGAP